MLEFMSFNGRELPFKPPVSSFLQPLAVRAQEEVMLLSGTSALFQNARISHYLVKVTPPANYPIPLELAVVLKQGAESSALLTLVENYTRPGYRRTWGGLILPDSTALEIEGSKRQYFTWGLSMRASLDLETPEI